MYKKVCEFILKSVGFLSTLFHVDERFIKYLFVGALNTAFAYCLYALLVLIGLEPNIALTFQYVIGILWNFKTTGSLVFKNHNNMLIFKFFGCYIITFTLNSILLYILTEWVKINDYIAQALLVLPIALIAFTIMKFYVFKEENNDNGEV